MTEPTDPRKGHSKPRGFDGILSRDKVYNLQESPAIQPKLETIDSLLKKVESLEKTIAYIAHQKTLDTILDTMKVILEDLKDPNNKELERIDLNEIADKLDDIETEVTVLKLKTIDSLLKKVQSLKKTSAYDTYQTILDAMQAVLEKPTNLDGDESSEINLSEMTDKLGIIEAEVIEQIKNIEGENNHKKIQLAKDLQSEYKALDKKYKDSTLQLKNSRDDEINALNTVIVESLQELNFFNDNLSEKELLIIDTEGVGTALGELTVAIENFEKLTEKNIQREAEVIKRLQEGADEKSIQFNNLKQAAANLTGVSEVEVATLREKEIVVQDAFTNFKSSMSDTTLQKIDEAVDTYKIHIDKILTARSNRLREAEENALATAQKTEIPTPPAQPMPTVSVAVQAPAAPPIPDPIQTKPPLSPENDDTHLDTTSIPGVYGNDDIGYTVATKTGNVYIEDYNIIPTIFNFDSVSGDLQKTGKLFSEGLTLKEGVLSALRAENFTEATDRAKELGVLLDAIENKKHLIIGTLGRFTKISTRRARNENDLLEALHLKEEILKARASKDLDLADEKAEELGAELTRLEEGAKKAIAPIEKNTSVDPEAKGGSTVTPSEKETDLAKAFIGISKERGFWNTIIPTIKLNKLNNKWMIMKGETFVQMTEDEYVWWGFIKNTFEEYSQFIKTPQDAYENSHLVALKNQIIEAVLKNNYEEATALAKELSHEFDPMLDRDTVPDAEKTAARLQYEERKQNIDKLNNPESFVLEDETVRFAFIKDPLSNTQREFLVIDRNSGDWVPLTREDLTYMGTIWSAITNFKVRVSSPSGCVEKKNMILNLVNRYNFKGAAEAAQEYLDEFGVLTRNKTLRPEAALSTPPAKVTKGAEATAFLTGKKKLADVRTVLEKILILLSSEAEKNAFTRMLTDITALEGALDEKITKESLTTFLAKLEFLTRELAKKEKFFGKEYFDLYVAPSQGSALRKGLAVEEFNEDMPFGKYTLPPTRVLPPTTRVLRNKRLRGNTSQEETLEERAARQHAQENDKDKEESRKAKSHEESVKRHAEMFKRDPDLYEHVYGQKNNQRDSLTEKTALIPQQEQKTPKEFLQILIQKKADLESRWKKLLDHISKGTALGSPEIAEEELVSDIAELDREIQKYTKMVLNDMGYNNSHTHYKQVYSPMHDHSLDKQSREGAHVKKEPSSLILPDIQLDTPLEKKSLGIDTVLLSESTHPSHTEGMMRPIDMDQNRGAEQTGLAQNNQESKEDDDAPKNELLEKEVEDPEKNRERFATVGKVADKVFTFPSIQMKPWGWLAAGLTSIASGAAMLSAYDTYAKKQENERPRTIGEVLRRDLEWETFVADKVPASFITDFTGPKKLSIEEFLKTHVPSFGINPNNTSAQTKLEKLLCKDIYTIPGANEGITPTQQKECSALVKNLVEIMTAAQASMNILYKNGDTVFGNMTVLQMYEATQKAIAAADTAKSNLQTT